MTPDTDTLWRICNAGTALLALVLFVRAALRGWRTMNVRSRFYAQTIAAFLAVTVEGSIEQIHQGNPIGFRTALTTCAVLWVLYAVLFTPPGNYAEEGRD